MIAASWFNIVVVRFQQLFGRSVPKAGRGLLRMPPKKKAAADDDEQADQLPLDAGPDMNDDDNELLLSYNYFVSYQSVF